METMMHLENIGKTFQHGTVETTVLKGISFTILKGEYVAIVGASGSGKSTLMNILGCLDTQTSGKFYLKGKDVKEMSEKEKTQFRGKELGFIFQKFHLLSQLSALENVQLPLLYQKDWGEGKTERGMQLLRQVGLEEKMHLTPKQLSGGQQQRVAVARALACGPDIILADEPTGNLDSGSSQMIMKMLEKLNGQGKTLIIITHDKNIAKSAGRIISIESGTMQSDFKNICERTTIKK